MSDYINEGVHKFDNKTGDIYVLRHKKVNHCDVYVFTKKHSHNTSSVGIAWKSSSGKISTYINNNNYDNATTTILNGSCDVDVYMKSLDGYKAIKTLYEDCDGYRSVKDIVSGKSIDILNLGIYDSGDRIYPKRFIHVDNNVFNIVYGYTLESLDKNYNGVYKDGNIYPIINSNMKKFKGYRIVSAVDTNGKPSSFMYTDIKECAERYTHIGRYYYTGNLVNRYINNLGNYVYITNYRWRQLYARGYRICSVCGRLTKISTGVCRRCSARISTTIFAYHSMTNRKPLKIHGVDKIDKDNNNHYGIELEVENRDVSIDHNSDKDIAMRKNIQSITKNTLISYESDGSVSGNGGFELIFNPMTIDFARTKPISNVLNILNDNDYIGHDAEDAGLHIHIDRHHFDGGEIDETHIRRMIWMLSCNKELVTRLSRKSEDAIENWASIPDAYEYGDIHLPSSSSHSVCINLQHPSTVEFRIFKSTLNHETLVASIELVELIARYTKKYAPGYATYNLADIIESSDYKELKNYYNRRIK